VPLILPINYQLQVATANRINVKKKPCKKDLVVVGGGALPELGDVNVKITSPGLRLGYVTFYEIQVHPTQPGLAPWRVLRRYRHFRALASEATVRSDWPLPPKLWTNAANRDSKNLEERRQGLALWLQGALQQSPLDSALAKFLLLGRCPLEPLELEPSAPELDEDQMYLLEVQVPEGLGPDDLLKVQVPGNEFITISLPWGLVPGTPLRLWWDPISNSLAVHHIQDWQALRK